MKKYIKTCVFCKIAKKEKEHFQIWENESCVAFLDHSPHTIGHTLVIPKKHVGYVFSLNEKEYLELLKASERVAKALQQLTKCKRVYLGISGFEINHTHVHLIPVNNLKDLRIKIRKPSNKKQAEFVQKLKEIL